MLVNLGEVIMFSKDNILQSICRVPGVNEKSIGIEEDNYIISAKIKTCLTLKGKLLLIDYNVKIDFPREFPQKLPKVFVQKGEISNKFGHVNYDKSLCLGTDVDLRIRLLNSEPIGTFFKIVIAYLAEYQYWSEYHLYAIEPRSHYNNGVIETYQEMMGIKNLKSISDLLQSIPVRNVDRNKLCPCRSGLKMKNCHYQLLVILSKNKSIIQQVKKDMEMLNEQY